MAQTRPDSYVLLLQRVKADFSRQCRNTLPNSTKVLNDIMTDPNYDSAASIQEKTNIATLIQLVAQATEVLSQIKWDE